MNDRDRAAEGERLEARDAARFARAVRMNQFLLLHMLRMYRAFHGDLVECLVLGAIAYKNIDCGSATVEDDEPIPTVTVERVEARFQSEPPELLPAYAKSIAGRTGIPRETVRRKVAALMSKGWVVQDERSGLRLTKALEPVFRKLNEETLSEFLEVAAELNEAAPIAEPPERDGARRHSTNGASRAGRSKCD